MIERAYSPFTFSRYVLHHAGRRSASVMPGNAFRIRMVGEKVSVWLNGIKVVDEVVMENYWDRSQPIPTCDQIEMQAHGSLVNFRNIYVKEL